MNGTVFRHIISHSATLRDPEVGYNYSGVLFVLYKEKEGKLPLLAGPGP